MDKGWAKTFNREGSMVYCTILLIEGLAKLDGEYNDDSILVSICLGKVWIY